MRFIITKWRIPYVIQDNLGTTGALINPIINVI